MPKVRELVPEELRKELEVCVCEILEQAKVTDEDLIFQYIHKQLEQHIKVLLRLSEFYLSELNLLYYT